MAFAVHGWKLVEVLIKDSKALVRLREAWTAGTIESALGLDAGGVMSTDICHHWTESSLGPCSFMNLQQTRVPGFGRN